MSRQSNGNDKLASKKYTINFTLSKSDFFFGGQNFPFGSQQKKKKKKKIYIFYSRKTLVWITG